MTSYAIVRPALDSWDEPITVLVCERPTLEKAEAAALMYLQTWPCLWIERWDDSYYTLQPDGSKKWHKWQKTEVVRTFQGVGK